MSFYNGLTRHVLAPTFDIIRGTHTMQRLAELERSQWLPRERIEDIQVEGLQKLIRYAYLRVPYYRRTMDSLGLNPEDIKSPQDLARIPPLTKQLIRDNFDNLIAEGFPPGQLRRGNSGGTTGERLHFCSTRQERLTLAYARWARTLAWSGVSLGDAHMSIRQQPNRGGLKPSKVLGRLSVRLQRAQMVDTMTVHEENLSDIFDLIQRTRPRSINSYPSALALLASYARAENRTCAQVHSVCLGGEQTLDHQRAIIREVFGSDPYIRYGSNELHEVAGQCELRGGLHIFAEDFIIEIVDEDGNPLPPGQRGRMLITSLHNYGMPFIRYENGDIGSLLSRTCSCGRGLPLMSPQIGRTMEYIFRRSGAPIAAMDINVAGILPRGVVQYQLIQDSIGDFTLVMVPPDPSATATANQARESVENMLKASLGEDVTVNLPLVERIDMNMSGKRLSFISKVDTTAMPAKSGLWRDSCAPATVLAAPPSSTSDAVTSSCHSESAVLVSQDRRRQTGRKTNPVSIYNTFARNILAPSLDRMRGTRTMQCLTALEESQWWPKERIEQLQSERLHFLVQHVWRSVPYYRHLMEERGLSPGDICAATDLPKLPALTKDLIRANFDDLISAAFPREQLRLSTTGGSTGTPLVFFGTKDDQMSHGFARGMRALEYAGFTLGERRVLIRIARQHDSAKERVLHNLSRPVERLTEIDSRHVSTDSLPGIVALLQHPQMRLFGGYPSAVSLVASWIRETGVRARALDAIVTGGEQLFDHQRAVIKQVFGSEPYSKYACNEFFDVAMECPEHSGMHIHAEDLIVEVVDDDGKPVPHGHTGRVLITNLHNFGMPFIRYELGDTGALVEGDCPCGRALPRLATVVGRRFDFIYTPSGRRVAGSGLGSNRLALLPVRQFQYVQEDLDLLVVNVVPRADASAEDLANMSARIPPMFNEIVGNDMTVRVQFVDHIELTTAGKHLLVISKIDPNSWLKRSSVEQET
ncbi:MAG: phenylacetate--CoA ligase family protein [Dehalococcoidia bacterium]|nr:phenylacetate--CoA ligase family protein [Dehalococcoidia bacterium]